MHKCYGSQGEAAGAGNSQLPCAGRLQRPGLQKVGAAGPMEAPHRLAGAGHLPPQLGKRAPANVLQLWGPGFRLQAFRGVKQLYSHTHSLPCAACHTPTSASPAGGHTLLFSGAPHGLKFPPNEQGGRLQRTLAGSLQEANRYRFLRVGSAVQGLSRVGFLPGYGRRDGILPPAPLS